MCGICNVGRRILETSREFGLVPPLHMSTAVELYTTEMGRRVIQCAIEVHQTLGPGLLESVYDRCLAYEFGVNGLPFRQQVPTPIRYKGLDMGTGYRVDFVVGTELLVELKTVERLLPIHDAQVLTYLKLLGIRQAFVFNFNATRLMSGFRSLLNGNLRDDVPHTASGFSVE